MPQIDVNEEQVLRALDQLSPTARRLALAKLIPEYDALDRLVERNRRLALLAQAFYRLRHVTVGFGEGFLA